MSPAILPWIIAALIVVLLAAAITTWWALRRMPSPQKSTEAQPEASANGPNEQSSFLARMQDRWTRLASTFKPQRNKRIAIVGTPGAGASAFADTAGVTTLAQGEIVQPVQGFRCLETFDGQIIDFGDGLLNLEDWRHQWRSSLHTLSSQRQDGALDSLVFVVPYAKLQHLAQVSQGALTVFGERLSELVIDVQDIAGRHTPVTLVLSGFESDASFSAFQSILSRAGDSDALIGWSAPNGPEASFEPAWIDDAVNTIVTALDEFSFDAAALGVANISEGALSASLTLQGLAPALRTLIKPLMRQRAGADTVMLRGIYLTGATSSSSPQTKFLFRKKLFPEASLARWAQARVRRHRLWRGRFRFGTGIAAMIGIGAIAYLMLFTARPLEAEQLLHDMNRYIALNTASWTAGEEVNLETLKAQSRALIAEIGTAQSRTMTRWAAPLSKTSEIDETLHRAYKIALVEVCLAGIVQGLDRQIQDAAGSLPRSEHLSLEEYETLARTLTQIDHAIRLYERLPGEPDAEVFSELSELVLDIRPSSDFEAVYRQAFAPLDATPSVGGIRDWSWPAVEAALGGPDHTQVLDQLYRQDPLSQAVDRVAFYAQQFQSSRVSGEDQMRNLESLASAVATAERLLSQPDSNWIDYGDTASEGRINAATLSLAALSFADPNFGAGLRRDLATARDRAREHLQSLQGLNNRSVLIETSDGFRLRPIYIATGSAIDDLLQVEELAPAGGSGLGPEALPPAGVRFAWQRGPLEQAQASAEWMLVSAPALISSSAPELRGTLSSLVRARGQARINALIRQAIGPLGPQAGARGEAVAFAGVSNLLAELRDNARVLDLTAALDVLDRTANTQADRILSDVQAELDQTRPYALRQVNVALWDGNTPSDGALLNVRASAEFPRVLADWRTYTRSLALERAQPVLTYFNSETLDPVQSRRVADWTDIAASLRAYDEQRPGNSLGALERFVLEDIATLSLQTCPSIQPEASPGSGWFSQKLANMKTQLQARCDELTSDAINTALNTLANRFETVLANRFPFSGAGSGAPLEALNELSFDLDPAQVRQFFAHNQAILDQLSADALSGSASPSALVRELDATRSFLGLAGPTQVDAIAFAVDIDFGTNAPQSPGQSEIVEWRLTIGDLTVSSLEPPRSLIWAEGDPVSLSARWASGATNQPAPPSRPDRDLSERQLTVSYEGNWALLALIAVNTASTADLTGLADPRSNLLKITVPLEPNPDAVTGGLGPLETATLMPRIVTRQLNAQSQRPTGAPLTMPIFPDQS